MERFTIKCLKCHLEQPRANSYCISCGAALVYVKVASIFDAVLALFLIVFFLPALFAGWCMYNHGYMLLQKGERCQQRPRRSPLSAE